MAGIIPILLLVVLCTSVADGLSLSWLSTEHAGDIHAQYAPRTVGTYYDLRSFSSLSSPSSSRWRRDVGTAEPAAISSLHIVARVTSRFSETIVTSVIDNPTENNQEAVFKLDIPEQAFISNFTMVIDGKLIVTQVKSKAEADEIYEKAKNDNKTAGKVESSQPPYSDQPPPGMERFMISITVKAESEVTVELTYQQLLHRINGMYEQIVSMRPGQIVPDFRVDVYVYDKQGVKDISLFEPSLEPNSLEYQIAVIEKVSDVLQHVSFYPTEAQQRQMNAKLGVDRELIVSYDVEHEDNAGLLQVDNGEYFAHYFSPEEAPYSPLDKHIVFVVDISGSMTGRKMDQTREAFRTIIDQLREGDTFLLLLFDDVLEFWPSSQEPVRATSNNIRDAIYYADRKLHADGGTNIALAVTTACSILRQQNNPLGSNLVMFLTDGEPTVGETSTNRIVAMTTDAAAGQVAIFSLAIGFSLDFELLEKLAYRTGGSVERIYDTLDAADQLTEFYYTIATPIMYDIDISYPTDVVEVGSSTPTHFQQHFQGAEIVVVGKLNLNAGQQSFEATVTGQAKKGNLATSEVRLTSTSSMVNQLPTEVASQDGFVEKLYVYFQIKQLLKETLMTDDETKKEALEAKALALALEYRLVTPLTSMIIVQPDGDVSENAGVADIDTIDYITGNVMSNSALKSYSTEGRVGGLLGFAAYLMVVTQGFM